MFRTAISLNNSGITLLSRGFLREAHDTLRKSARILQAHVALPCGNNAQQDVSSEDVAKSVQETDRTMAHTSRLMPPQHHPDLPQVSVLSHDEQDVLVLLEALLSDSKESLHAIRVEVSDEVDVDVKIDFISSIIIYNIALAGILCTIGDSDSTFPGLGQTSTQTNVDAKLTSSFKLLDLAHRNLIVLCNAEDAMEDDCNGESGAHDRRADEYMLLFCNLVGCMAQKAVLCATERDPDVSPITESKRVVVRSQLKQLQADTIDDVLDLLNPGQVAGAA